MCTQPMTSCVLVWHSEQGLVSSASCHCCRVQSAAARTPPSPVRCACSASEEHRAIKCGSSTAGAEGYRSIKKSVAGENADPVLNSNLLLY